MELMVSASLVDPASLTVLLVDDDPDLCELLSRFLLRQGIKALTASSGVQCLDMIQDFPTIDVIVLDVMMPGMDGLEVGTTLKQREATRNIPIIFLTARGDEKTHELALQLGANAFLVKPISSRTLLAHILAQVGKGQPAITR
jgi:CheY-like chemotaxis protein